MLFNVSLKVYGKSSGKTSKKQFEFLGGHSDFDLTQPLRKAMWFNKSICG
jgi:hypothetical protein